MDGDTEWPTICGTGTEDYFCGSYDFDTHSKNAAGVSESHYTEFDSPYSGLAQVIKGDGHYDVSTTTWPPAVKVFSSASNACRTADFVTVVIARPPRAPGR